MTVEVRYLVHDVDAGAEFHLTHLGFTEQESWGAPFRLLARGDLRLWVSGPGSSAARLRDAGVRFRNEIVEGPGGKQVVIEDPSGNPVELFQPTGDQPAGARLDQLQRDPG